MNLKLVKNFSLPYISWSLEIFDELSKTYLTVEQFCVNQLPSQHFEVFKLAVPAEKANFITIQSVHLLDLALCSQEPITTVHDWICPLFLERKKIK